MVLSRCTQNRAPTSTRLVIGFSCASTSGSLSPVTSAGTGTPIGTDTLQDSSMVDDSAQIL